MINPESRERDREPMLVSRTSILILSAVLILFSFDFAHEELGFYLFTLGQFGLVAFLGLDQTSRKFQRAFAAETGRPSVEARLARHLQYTSPLSNDLLQEQRYLLEWLRNETRHLD